MAPTEPPVILITVNSNTTASTPSIILKVYVPMSLALAMLMIAFLSTAILAACCIYKKSVRNRAPRSKGKHSRVVKSKH